VCATRLSRPSRARARRRPFVTLQRLLLSCVLLVGLISTSAVISPTYAQAQPSTGVSCFGDYCSGQQPDVTGCDRDAVTSAFIDLTGARLDLRSSPTCKTSWARYEQYPRGWYLGNVPVELRVVQEGGYTQRLSYDINGPGTGTTWSPMIYTPDHLVRAELVVQCYGVGDCAAGAATGQNPIVTAWSRPPAPMWQVVKDPGQPWQRFDISTGIPFQGTPAVLWGSTVNVFGVATNGRLVQLSIVPGQTGWRAYDLFPPGSFTGGVDAIQIGSTIQIFGIDGAGRMWQVVKDAGQPWQRFDISTGNAFQGTPAVLWGSTVNVFGVATNGRLVQLSIVPGQTGWRAYDLFPPGSFTAGVDAIQFGATIQIFGT
jgi:hypothetical protein